jgi:hypothetical protein
MSLAACTRIETGEIGLRVGFDKQINQTELLPGSFNQTLIGEVKVFPVKDVTVLIDDMTPVAKDNSTMADFDMTIVYSIDPSHVSEIYSQKNRSFHFEFSDGKQKGETLLMYNNVLQVARNAAYKAARDYEALDMADQRVEIEGKIKATILESLKAEKLDASVHVTQVLVRSIKPALAVVASANELVKSKNDLKQKEVEVKIAETEARRMAAISNQSQASIAYMNAQSLNNLSLAALAGKVQTIVVPYDFKGIVNVK